MKSRSRDSSPDSDEEEKKAMRKMKRKQMERLNMLAAVERSAEEDPVSVEQFRLKRKFFPEEFHQDIEDNTRWFKEQRKLEKFKKSRSSVIQHSGDRSPQREDGVSRHTAGTMLFKGIKTDEINKKTVDKAVKKALAMEYNLAMTRRRIAKEEEDRMIERDKKREEAEKEEDELAKTLHQAKMEWMTRELEAMQGWSLINGDNAM
uniref:DUF2040 domain-containing protein n=1 Tax=Caenorhabditis tropicalis TaxID=1561998 RepID=A0A1I7URV2_9PELO